jgi:hypothetical protein
MGPRAGLDVVEKRKILPCRESNSVRPALILVTTELSRLLLFSQTVNQTTN